MYLGAKKALWKEIVGLGTMLWNPYASIYGGAFVKTGLIKEKTSIPTQRLSGEYADVIGGSEGVTPRQIPDQPWAREIWDL